MRFWDAEGSAIEDPGDLAGAVEAARREFPRKGLPDVCLVISHAHRLRINETADKREAPKDAVLIEYKGAAAGTNAPQTMRVWPGLKVVGAGGKVAKGVFVKVVACSGDSVELDGGLRFSHAELLRHTRLCHAITYASCQGLTLRGRVWLCDAGTQHFEQRHLYAAASRATAAELLSVL